MRLSLQERRGTSPNHLRMSDIDRAAQFTPFATLTGYEGAVKEAAGLTDAQVELDEDAVTVLNIKLQLLEKYGASNSVRLLSFRQPLRPRADTA